MEAADVGATTGATYGADVVVVWVCVAVGCCWPLDEPLLLPLLFDPPLCSVVGWWLEPPPEWLGLWVGFLVGLGVDGGAGGGAAWVGSTVAVGSWVGCAVAVGVLVGVGVDCVGAAATAEKSALPPEPDALCGHQATRHAARPSNAATAKRATFVLVLVTAFSSVPWQVDGSDSLPLDGTALPATSPKIQRSRTRPGYVA